MISTYRIIQNTYDVLHVRPERETISATSLEELEHLVSIYREYGYTIKSKIAFFNGLYIVYMTKAVYILGFDLYTVIGFN